MLHNRENGLQNLNLELFLDQLFLFLNLQLKVSLFSLDSVLKVIHGFEKQTLHCSGGSVNALSLNGMEQMDSEARDRCLRF